MGETDCCGNDGDVPTNVHIVGFTGRKPEYLLVEDTRYVPQADPPPDGYPSWEDWLTSTPYRVRMMLGEGWYVERDDDGMYVMVTKPGEFFNYPQAREIAKQAALAAAKKEAGR